MSKIDWTKHLNTLITALIVIGAMVGMIKLARYVDPSAGRPNVTIVPACGTAAAEGTDR